jgi:N-acetylglucosamine-6-phosphate deacetylase
MTALGPRGKTLVTLAPEMHATLRDGVIAQLTKAGIIVSAGHTMATAEELEEAVRQGLSGYTHLFNAMPPLAGRAPGPVGAALAERNTFVSIIVDLHHVSVPSLCVALAAKRPEKLMLITDAMPTVGTDLEQFELPGATAFRKDGKLTTADGTLAGSDLDMASAVRNTVQRLGIDLPTALKMASRVPAEFLGLEKELGRIAPGYRANLVLLDGEMKAVATWIDGVEESS